MREIEFRGYYTGDSHFESGFVYGYFIGSKESSIMERDGCMCWSVEPESIGQFTGLTDRNGTKIFEGDIVQLENEHQQGVIEFKSSAFIINGLARECGFIDTLADHSEQGVVEWEVIGNIYEN